MVVVDLLAVVVVQLVASVARRLRAVVIGLKVVGIPRQRGAPRARERVVLLAVEVARASAIGAIAVASWMVASSMAWE